MDRDKNQLSKTREFKPLHESGLSQDASAPTKDSGDSQLRAKRSFKWLGVAATVAASIIALLIIWSAVSAQSGGLAIFYKCLFFISIIWIIIALFLYRSQAAQNPEKIFLVIILTLTCTSSVLYDTNEPSWDLAPHFDFMLEYANPGDVYEFTEADSAISQRNFTLPYEDPRITMINELYGSSDTYLFTNAEFWQNTDMLKLKDEILNEIDHIKDDTQVVDNLLISHFTSHNLYNRIGSLSGSLIFFICNLFGVPFVIKFILARLSYAFIYSFVLYFGMRKLRSGKMILAVVALYPTAVFITANYSYDYWVIAWMIYAIASIVGQMQTPEKEIQLKDQVKIILAFVIGLGPKAIYFPLILLCWLIPKDKFNSGRACWIFRIASFLAMCLVLASFCIPYFVRDGLPSDIRGGSDVDGSRQIAFILSHPFEYAVSLMNHMWSYLSIEGTKGYMISFAYLGFGSSIVWLLLLSLTLLTTLTDTKYSTKQVNNAKTRIVDIVLILGTIALVCTSLYISFTPVGSSVFSGVQARYLLPLIFPFLIFMGTAKMYWPRTERAQGAYNLAVLILLAFSNYQILWSAYVSILY